MTKENEKLKNENSALNQSFFAYRQESHQEEEKLREQLNELNEKRKELELLQLQTDQHYQLKENKLLTTCKEFEVN